MNLAIITRVILLVFIYHLHCCVLCHSIIMPTFYTPAPPPQSSLTSRLISFLAHHAVSVGLVIRLLVAYFLPLWLDDTGVAYTDIDYHVFTDAAAYIRQENASPYQRTTYRYTPFLAQLVAFLGPHFRVLARYLFCVVDVLCGYMIGQLRRQERRQSSLQRQTQRWKGDEPSSFILLMDALWWLYNPLAINICTRGSAESLNPLLFVLLTVQLVTQYQQQQQQQSSYPQRLLLPTAAGVVHGIAVHAKLYPIIYSLSYVMALAQPPTPTQEQQQHQQQGRTTTTTTRKRIQQFIQSLMQPAPLLFAITSASVFVGTTALSIYLYGREALDEGLLYHFSRVDHRHNYSMHWYWIYLTRAVSTLSTTTTTGISSSSSSTTTTLFLLGNNTPTIDEIIPWIGRLLLVPQLVLLVYTSLVLAPRHLTLALFVQTYSFVALNKVVTAQYFTWYLCLLPLCAHRFQFHATVQRAVGLLFIAILMWLGSAYSLEMQGWATHRLVWAASVVFFAAEIHLLVALLRSTSSRRRRGENLRVKGD